MQLRPYQNEAKQGVYAGWASGLDNMLVVLPTGAGKTVVLSSIIHDHNAPACVIAHRQELVSQISIALAREGVAHNIIAPKSVVKACVNLHLAETGRSFYDMNAHTAVAGVDTLLRRSDLGAWARRVTLWVQDECFPAGTLVDGRPIEEIQVGDYVTAFNEETGGFESREVVRLFKNKAPAELVRLSAGHHVLDCTKGHPIFTQRGWVDAGAVTERDFVYILPDTNNRNDGEPALPLAQNGPDLLQKSVWVRPPRRETEAGQTSPHPAPKIGARAVSRLRGARADGGAAKDTTPKNRPRILRENVLDQVPGGREFQNDGGNQPEVRFRTDAGAEPHAQGGNPGESVDYFEADRPRPEDTRRQWAATYRRRKRARAALRGARLPTAANRTDGTSAGRRRVAQPLQNRLWSRWAKNSHRSGRGGSQRVGAESAGREERRVFEWRRVDRVEIFKREDIRSARDGKFDGFVYNIEVEGLHTYVAEGAVVHNCHHVLRDNKWGKAAALFPNAKGLGVTATPLRADGMGLGIDSDGLFDDMVIGPTMRDLINDGFLTEYKIYAPPNDIDLTAVNVTATGDYSGAKLKTAVRKSHVIGDVVEHYLKIAKGKLGVTFATDVETATDIAEQFSAAGVPAAVVSAKSSDSERIKLLADFKARKLLQLVNVDLFGEGFDLPAIEVVSMARPTQSYGLYVQQFGRALRLLDGKVHALIIDHVGNVQRHGLPDAPRTWSLDRRDKRGKSAPSDAIPVKSCPQCTAVFERIYKACPECGFEAPPAGRSAPEQVDGDLVELDAATLAQMRGEVERMDRTEAEVLAECSAKHMPHVGQLAAAKRHRNNQEMQGGLRESMAWWGGHHRAAGRSDSEIYRLFYLKFGVDMLSAQALKLKEAEALANSINMELGKW